MLFPTKSLWRPDEVLFLLLMKESILFVQNDTKWAAPSSPPRSPNCPQRRKTLTLHGDTPKVPCRRQTIYAELSSKSLPSIGTSRSEDVVSPAENVRYWAQDAPNEMFWWLLHYPNKKSSKITRLRLHAPVISSNILTQTESRLQWAVEHIRQCIKRSLTLQFKHSRSTKHSFSFIYIWQ